LRLGDLVAPIGATLQSSTRMTAARWRAMSCIMASNAVSELVFLANVQLVLSATTTTMRDTENLNTSSEGLHCRSLPQSAD